MVMLDVALGLVFVYLVLSLLASALAEALEHFFHYRADYLKQGIERLLLAGDSTLREKLYAHPLVKSLYTPSRLEGRFARASGPAYIPSRQFVLALLDIVGGSTPSSPGGAPGAPVPVGNQGIPAVPPVNAASQLLLNIQANATLPAPLKQALRTLITDAGDDMEAVKRNVEAWFNGSMDRVAGWYKRRAQFVLLVIGTTVAVVVNADTLWIITTLSNDATVRSAVVSAAETYAREQTRPPAEDAERDPSAQTGNAPRLDDVTRDVRGSVQAVSSQLGALGLPVGWRYYVAIDKAATRELGERTYRVNNRIWPTWSGAPEARWIDLWRDQLASHLLGWMLTAFALSFGAPFWFDILNKIMVVRSTVKPREKSREEGSEDRR